MNVMMMMMMMMMQVTSLYVEDPTRTRIMQWTNITNRDGKLYIRSFLASRDNGRNAYLLSL